MGGKGRGKGFKDIGKMKGVSGPYGQRRASELQRAGKKEMEGQRDTIAQMLDFENMNRWLSSVMSGLGTAGKARHGASLAKEGATMGDKMKYALEGNVGEGYKLGAKDTGDFWEFGGFNQRTMNPMELAETNPYNIMGLDRGGDIGRLDYGSEPSLLDALLAMQKGGR